MRTKSIIFLLVILPSVCQAELIQIGLTGQVDYISDPYDLLENKIHLGDTITGFYTYDSATLDSAPLVDIGLYQHTTILLPVKE